MYTNGYLYNGAIVLFVVKLIHESITLWLMLMRLVYILECAVEAKY